MVCAADTPNGFISSGRMHYYIKDYQGNVRQVTDGDGVVEQDNHYYPYGMLMGESSNILASARGYKSVSFNPYLYGSKEYLTTASANLLDFTARTYDPATLFFLTPDPLREKFTSTNGYLYCSSNPINKIDPDGKREWPVDNPSPIGKVEHSNDFGKQTTPYSHKHPHGGVDINIISKDGNGKADNGAPVYATHDGKVVRIVRTEDGGGGGIRIRIMSTNGRVATFYMHLSKIEEGIKLGSYIKENQLIGKIGSTGRSSNPHLHYELSVDNEKVNPATSPKRLVDPQKLVHQLDNPDFYNEGPYSLDDVIIIGEGKLKDISLPPIKLFNNPKTLKLYETKRTN